MSRNGIRAIFFDFDGTLRFSQPAGRDVFMGYAATLGIRISPDQRALACRWEHLYWANSADLLKDEARYPESDAFWLNYSRRQLVAMGCSAEQATQLAPIIVSYMGENYKPENWVHPSTSRVLAELMEAGFILGVISNRDEPFDEELNRLDLGKYFSLAVSGGEAGFKKPEAGIFHYALGKAGVLHQEAIYVGDNYFADVVGARNAGVHPVLLDIDGIFEQPGCPSIKTLEDLPAIIEYAVKI